MEAIDTRTLGVDLRRTRTYEDARTAMKRIPEDEFEPRLTTLYVLVTLGWDYIETVLDIHAQMKKTMAEGFEDFFRNDFKILYFNLDTAAAGEGLDGDERAAFVALEQARTVLETVRIYSDEVVDRMFDRYGVPTTADRMTSVHQDFVSTYPLVDRLGAKSDKSTEWRRNMARVLYGRCVREVFIKVQK